jgi:hypothetical protein
MQAVDMHDSVASFKLMIKDLRVLFVWLEKGKCSAPQSGGVIEDAGIVEFQTLKSNVSFRPRPSVGPHMFCVSIRYSGPRLQTVP